ncbi:MAG: hypothetical protein J2P54_06325 [Bradyrhizobiaceae bacterium]|nr:hypothetical protein [Bradyrhizobiaceae bacterium]
MVIVVAGELGLPDDIVNVEGGAVAHGHPIGATGAVLTTKLIHSMRRDGPWLFLRNKCAHPTLRS